MFLNTKLLISGVLNHTIVHNRFFSTTSVICDGKRKWETQSGYQTNAEKDKLEKGQNIFDALAKKYDMMNDLILFGLFRVWKYKFLERIGQVKNKNIIDVAGGTGDIGLMILNKIKDNTGSTHVTVCDINETMLNVGRMRSKRQGFHPDLITWKIDNGESLSFPDNTFDIYTISFGIRNVAHIDKVLQEAHRVLKPGGQFHCLELYGQLENKTAQWFYDQYILKVLPVICVVCMRELQSYRYLVESIRNTPNKDIVTSMIKDAGFKKVTCENLTYGTASIHYGIKQ